MINVREMQQYHCSNKILDNCDSQIFFKYSWL